jgi:hypothetical protein
VKKNVRFGALFYLVAAFFSSCVSTEDAELFVDVPPGKGAQAEKAVEFVEEEGAPDSENSVELANAPVAITTERPQQKAQPEKAESISPPVDVNTKGAVLPLPENTAQMTVHSFLRDYKTAYAHFGELIMEYRYFFEGVNTPGAGGDEEREALKIRVRENFERAHWVFLLGCDDLNNYLAAEVKGELVSSREENFIARMKTLAFLAKELSEVAGDKKYQKFARALYMRQSAIHFGRKLEPLKGESSAKDN